VVESLVIVLLHIFSWFWQWNDFENRLLLDKVKAYQKTVPFFGPPCRFLRWSLSTTLNQLCWYTTLPLLRLSENENRRTPRSSEAPTAVQDKSFFCSWNKAAETCRRSAKMFLKSDCTLRWSVELLYRRHKRVSGLTAHSSRGFPVHDPSLGIHRPIDLLTLIARLTSLYQVLHQQPALTTCHGRRVAILRRVPYAQPFPNNFRFRKHSDMHNVASPMT